jgi:hypothetical protein
VEVVRGVSFRRIRGMRPITPEASARQHKLLRLEASSRLAKAFGTSPHSLESAAAGMAVRDDAAERIERGIAARDAGGAE